MSPTMPESYREPDTTNPDEDKLVQCTRCGFYAPEREKMLAFVAKKRKDYSRDVLWSYLYWPIAGSLVGIIWGASWWIDTKLFSEIQPAWAKYTCETVLVIGAIILIILAFSLRVFMRGLADSYHELMKNSDLRLAELSVKQWAGNTTNARKMLYIEAKSDGDKSLTVLATGKGFSKYELNNPTTEDKDSDYGSRDD